jgi:preprotein translocase subunit SecY
MRGRNSSDKLGLSLDLSSLGRAAELRSRIFFVFIVLIFYKFGSYVPLPGINSLALSEFSAVQAEGVLGMFNMFTGGALGRMSVFALNIMPYITASIIMQLMTVISTNIAALKNEGDQGRKKINQYTRYLTVVLALVQGYGIAVGVEQVQTSHGSLVAIPGIYFRLLSMISLTGGTVLVMWMAEQINQRGIGNGSSLIIFSGIVSGLPSALAAFFDLGRTGAISTLFIVSIFFICIAMVSFIVFMEKSQRRVLVNYPRRQVGNKVYGGDSTHLPLKLNTAGVIPAIFASSLLLFPLTIAGFSNTYEVGSWKQYISIYLSHGKPLYIALYAFLIGFFCFFYTSIIFNPDETAENLRKNGGVVLGYRPGKHTSDHLDYILTRITILGAIYMIIICVVPEILISKFSIPFYLGGTSLLIVVNVVIDLFTQIQTHLLSTQYESLMKKARIMGRM